MTRNDSAMRKMDTSPQEELNNEYSGPVGIGHAGNETLTGTPRLVTGIGRDGNTPNAQAFYASGVGRAGNAPFEPGTPMQVGGDGRGGLDDIQPDLFIDRQR